MITQKRLRPAPSIRKKFIFQHIFKHGSRAQGKCVTLWAKENTGEVGCEKGTTMLGVVVSRKTSPKATTRNLWKRRIREAFRKQLPQVKKNYAVIVQARFISKAPTTTEIENEIIMLLKKLKIIERNK